MPKKDKATKKKQYFEEVVRLVQSYPRVLVVGADHVGSRQLSDVRRSLRGKAVVLMGKNTKIRKCLILNKDKLPYADELRSTVKLNVGFIFCIADPAEVKKIVLEHRVPAPAKQGVIAPIDVSIPAGPTGMDPSQTSFFQALGISTKIVKGQIEIQSDISLITSGIKVTASQAVLLQKLNVKPFSYGLKAQYVVDEGNIYNADVLDITDEMILSKISEGVSNLAAFSRQIGFPTAASVPHSMMQGFKHCVAMSLTSGYMFPQMESIKKRLDNPGAFAAAAAPAAKAAPAAAKGKKEEVKEESSEDEGGIFDLFG